jgi:serine/threonine-protein kinase PknK
MESTSSTVAPRKPAARELPPGYEFLRVLSERPSGTWVALALRDSRPVVVRVDPGGASRERLAELALLASVEDPGLAPLVDHGALPGGRGAWLARGWISGQDLTEWVQGKTPEAIGALVARLGPALEHLHARGFVHADLKAGNVIVPDGDDPRPVITDFGLARRGGDAGESAPGGTLYALAPEVLLGAGADARADLFALGVLLHELLVKRRASAREFYGRFPREDFFAASGTAPEELPEWARDIVAALVTRDPEARPRSAAEVARTLAGRLGLQGLEVATRREPGVPAMLGRELWLEAWWREHSTGELAAPRLDWIVLVAGEDERKVCERMALHAALDGAAVRRLDLDRELAGVRDPAQLDRWAQELARDAAGVHLFAALPSGDPWSERALEALAAALEVAPARGDQAACTGGLAVVSRHEPPATAAKSRWRRRSLPPLAEADLARFVREHVAGEEGRLAELARLVHASAEGSASRAQRALAAAARSGFLIAGDERLRLRPGPLPARLDVGGPAVPAGVERGSRAARLLAALHVLGGRAPLGLAADLAGLDPSQAAAAAELLAELDALRARSGMVGRELEALGAEPAACELCGRDAWREMHRRRARDLEAEDAPRPSVVAHAFAAGECDAEAAAAECARLRERGSPELALELVDSLERSARALGLELEGNLAAERAFAWCALGQGERALAAAAPLQHGGARDRALLLRVRGHVALVRHEHREALEHFAAALELDPEDGGEALLGKARLLYELRRDEELCALCDELERSGRARAVRIRDNLRALEAMARLRLGQVDEARASLEAQLAEARAAGDSAREAATRTNLASVARSAGELDLALEHYAAAVEAYGRSGLLHGLAQARALFGAALRDAGRLREAHGELSAALALRERLGDRAGAESVRGMLGLCHAERGHARAALEELGTCAARLREAGRSRDAALLEARAEEVRARLGSTRPSGSSEADPAAHLEEGDPRILLARARSAWLFGTPELALARAERAEKLAEGLGLRALAEEGAFLRRALAGNAGRADALGASGAVREDAEILAQLARVPLDAHALAGLAEELDRRGRDDRAARILLALAARSPGKGGTQDRTGPYAARAEALFAACAAGLTDHESAHLRRTLLGIPDPWPEDLTSRTGSDDMETDVLKLLEINHRLVEQEDLSTLLGAIVEQALEASGAQRGFLVLEQDGELSVDTALDSRRGGIDAPDVELSGSVLRQALAAMAPVRVSNAADDPLLKGAPSVLALELRSILCVPFQVQPGLRGVLYVDHRLREGAFSERTERVLRLLADQAALAILQVRRLEEIRHLNRELNRTVVRKESDLRTARKALAEKGLPASAGGLVGNSAPMREAHRLIERAAACKLAVLVTGESGTGKELAARAVHELSERAEGAFVSESCAALPASLIEAELFGTRKGAYTGADRDREGLFERAHGGTLFLDEIGELPLELQAKLLRVLETSEVRRVGDSATRTVDFRLVAATNRDLEEEVRANRFRADLYYRLNGITIRMPPIAARVEDIPALVDHFLRLHEAETGQRREIAPAVLAQLVRRAWPGNVRELFNELARLLVLSEGVVSDPGLVGQPGPIAAGSGEGPKLELVKPLAQLEREAIEAALAKAGGDKREAARMLGISRAKVYQRLKDWGVTGEGE